jgi:hypothetical protein
LISTSPILYNDNNGIHNNIVLNLCNLLQYNQTTMQQLNNILIKYNLTQKDFLNQFIKALGTAGINSRY